MKLITEIELSIIILLVIGYLGINFVADLPRFLIGENLIYVFLYILAFISIYNQYSWAQPYTILLSSFNAGRVSRSIVSPKGERGELALQHIPLLTLILALASIALYSEINP